MDVPTHRYELGEPTPAEMSGHGSTGFRCELISHWLTENSDEEFFSPYDDIEITHI